MNRNRCKAGQTKTFKCNLQWSTIHVKRAKTTRLNTAIAMYMPANVQVTYGANYTDTEIGSMAERAADAITRISRGILKEVLEQLDAD